MQNLYKVVYTQEVYTSTTNEWLPQTKECLMRAFNGDEVLSSLERFGKSVISITLI
jgi:hypothetical protein